MIRTAPFIFLTLALHLSLVSLHGDIISHREKQYIELQHEIQSHDGLAKLAPDSDPGFTGVTERAFEIHRLIRESNVSGVLMSKGIRIRISSAMTKKNTYC